MFITSLSKEKHTSPVLQFKIHLYVIWWMMCFSSVGHRYFEDTREGFYLHAGPWDYDREVSVNHQGLKIMVQCF